MGGYPFAAQARPCIQAYVNACGAPILMLANKAWGFFFCSARGRRGCRKPPNFNRKSRLKSGAFRDTLRMRFLARHNEQNKGSLSFMRAKAVHSMTEGPLARSILAFSFPLMLSNVLQALFNMSDIAVVGRFAGAEALGSVGSTAILVTLFTGFLIGVGSGVNAVTARFLGARQHKDVEETVHTAFLLCLIIGLVEMTLGQIFARPLLELLHTKDELIDGATLYLRIYLLGIPAAAMYNYGNGVLSAAGDTKNPLYILTIAGVVNVILNLFFVIVCRLGVAGVALASAISLYLSVGLILLSLIRSANINALRRSALRICQDKARQLLALSLPAGA